MTQNARATSKTHRRKELWVRMLSVSAIILFLASAVSRISWAGDTESHSHENTHEHATHGADPHGPEPINWFSMNYKDGPDKAHSSPPLLFALVNFALFIIVIVVFAGKPLKQFLGSRHDKVKHNLDEAAKLRTEASAKLQEIGARLNRLDQEIAQLHKDVLADAEVEKRQIIENAHHEAKQVVAMAEKTLALEIRKVKTQLEREAIDAAMKAAESILKQQLNSADIARLNNDYLQQIASNTRASN